MMLMIVDTQEG